MFIISQNSYLGIDQSTNTNGVAIINDKNEIIYIGTIDLSKMQKDTEKDMGLKRQELKKQIKKLIKKYSIKKVFIEDVYYQSNPETHKKLSMILGSIIDLCLELKIDFKVLNNREWKSSILCGKIPKTREEQKKVIMKAMQTLFPDVEFKKQDECDALGILLCGIKQESRQVDLA